MQEDNENLQPSETATGIESRKWFALSVWSLRIIVGGVFLMSGLVKGVDLWGFVFKIEEYLAVWGLSEPRSLAVMGALFISSYEFVFGTLLLMGCYKRLAPWALSLTMVVWLPLTLYIWIANPVADCGCFGDFLVLSNFWTFIKNLILTAMLVYLLKYNAKVKQELFEPAIQWMVGALLTLYLIVVGLYGYNVQPMIDFRPYPVGAKILEGDADLPQEGESEDEDMVFVYEKEGIKKEFSLENLPDSSWEFVERIERNPSGASRGAGAAFTVYDTDGDDVTDDAIATEGGELLLVIPEIQRFDISYSSFLNDLYQWSNEHDVEMVCLVGADREGIDIWQDLSMASYPIYSVEDTKLKELSRGTMSLVYLDGGVIRNKLTLSSIDSRLLDDGPHGDDFIERMSPRPRWWFNILTGGLAAILVLIFLFQSLILAVSRWIKRKYQKKTVNLHSETDHDDTVGENEDNNNT